MKKIIVMILCTVFLCSCESSMAKEKELKFATDQYAVYDFIKTVFKGNEVTYTTDPLSKKAQDADLFICISSTSPGKNIYEIKKDVSAEGAEVWLSPERAINIFYGIYNKIISLDKSFAQEYGENYENYVISLQNLNTRYKNAVNDKTVLVGNECNLSALEKDYGFKTKTMKEKTGTVMSFVTEVKSGGINAVYYVRNKDRQPVEVVSEMTDCYCLPIDLCTVSDAKEIKNRPKYLRMLENNIKNLEMR